MQLAVRWGAVPTRPAFQAGSSNRTKRFQEARAAWSSPSTAAATAAASSSLRSSSSRCSSGALQPSEEQLLDQYWLAQGVVEEKQRR